MTINLKEIRKNKLIKQEDIAKKLGISRQTYSKIELNNSELTLGQAVKLAEIFDIDINELIGDKKMETTCEKMNKEIDWEKYKQIIKNCIKYGADEDGKITKTKLAKLGYLIDFGWYYNHLQSITGLQYRRLDQGPVPDAYFTMLEELEEEESITIKQKGKAYLIQNISTPDTFKLSEEELDFITKICTKWMGKETKNIVEFTHNQLPWKLCGEKEIIPYELITQEEPNNVY